MGLSGGTTAVGASGATKAVRFAATAPGTILGYSNQSSPTDIPTLEASIGRQFHGLRQNQQITTTSWTFANSDYDAGRRPLTYRSIQLNSGLYTDITSGVWDANLTTIGQGLLSSGRWTPGHAILTFMHEVALASNDFLGTSQNYIDAYRYIRVFFDTMGVTTYTRFGHYQGGPALMAYTGWLRQFTNGTVDSPTAGKSYDDYDPNKGSSPAPAGTDYYEIVGSDPYNQIVSGSLKYGTDAATLCDGPRAAAIARGKPLMFGEMGCADGATSQNHLDKAAWLDSLRDWIEAAGSHGPGGVIALLTTQELGPLYNWDSSAEALAAGQRLAASPYFV